MKYFYLIGIYIFLFVRPSKQSNKTKQFGKYNDINNNNTNNGSRSNLSIIRNREDLIQIEKTIGANGEDQRKVKDNDKTEYVFSQNEDDDECTCVGLNKEIKRGAKNYPKNATTKYKKMKMLAIILLTCKRDYNEYDRQFPFNLMRKITSTNFNFNKNNLGQRVKTWLKFIHPVLNNIGGCQMAFDLPLQRKFTLQHYIRSDRVGQSPSTKAVRSPFSLKTSDLLNTVSTNDWLYLGNQAFTFWVLSIDGKVKKEKRLRDTTHYRELDIEDPGYYDVDFFASSLLSNLNLRQPKLLRGKLKDFAAIVLGSIDCKILEANVENVTSIFKLIEKQFSNFEVKIPGSVTVDHWIQRNKKDEIFIENV